MPGRDSDQASPGARTIHQLLDDIAEPLVHSGGGTAAAVSAALAAATGALVVNLSASRKSNRDRASEIQDDLDRLTQLQQTLLVAAGEDEAILDDLMARYRARDTPDEEFTAALIRAAESTLAIARSSMEVCEIAARQAPNSSRFTVSDIGAAASLARGATIGALLTAETNIKMIERRQATGASSAGNLTTAMHEIDRRSEQAATSALAITRERLSS